MEFNDIEKKLRDLVLNINKDTFIYDLLLAYEFPKATIARIKAGDLNLSKDPDTIIFRKKFLFKKIKNRDPHDVIDELSNNNEVAKHEPRFIIVTDFWTSPTFVDVS